MGIIMIYYILSYSCLIVVFHALKSTDEVGFVWNLV